MIEQERPPPYFPFNDFQRYVALQTSQAARMSSNCFMKSILYHNTIITILCFHMNYNDVSRTILYRTRLELGAYLMHRFKSATDRYFVDGCSAQRRGKSDKAARPQLFSSTAIFYNRTRENRCSIL